ncbi:hypothetical protein LTR85_003975 [Meristemomyces frigidus]|nr:hypothetical protein LTR85_003975 [Meristemomyces frigidus]
MPPNITDSSVCATTTASGLSANRPAGTLLPTSPSPAYEIPPLLNAREIGHINALPQAARAAELAKRANTFASSGKCLFIHFAEPVLNYRRTELLSRGKNKKKYTKTALQLWQSLEEQQYDEWFFWYSVAVQLRIALSKGQISHEECLKNAGMPEDASVYIWHAEVAVAHYMGISPPLEPAETELWSLEGAIAGKGTDSDVDPKSKDDTSGAWITASFEHLEITVPRRSASGKAVVATSESGAAIEPQESSNVSAELLDTLPDRFEYTPNMPYSHFARYDLDEFRDAEGKRQTAMLRQLANLLDKSGKELFYYYMVPRLCRAYEPASDGSTVMSKAGDIWRFSRGPTKTSWASASAVWKKRLGDGDVDGLEVLQLDSLEPEVVRLHTLAAKAMESHAARKA